MRVWILLIWTKVLIHNDGSHKKKQRNAAVAGSVVIVGVSVFWAGVILRAQTQPEHPSLKSMGRSVPYLSLLLLNLI